MAIHLNAFPIRIPDKTLEVCVIPFEQEYLKTLRAEYQNTHTFRRRGNDILIFSSDKQYPVNGNTDTVSLIEDFSVFCFLVKDGLIRNLIARNRRPIGFNPIELVSVKSEDNLLAPILGQDYPFQILVKYIIDTRIIQNQPCLIIDSSTKTVSKENCSYFLQKGFDLTGRYVLTKQADGSKKLLGTVRMLNGEKLLITQEDGQANELNAKDVYLEASRKNFDDYLLHSHSGQCNTITEEIRQSVSSFNGGESKKSRIDTLKKYFQKQCITLIDGTCIEIEDEKNIQHQCGQLDKPIFVFNDNGETNWADNGLSRFGPYTKRTFDRNNPSICIICTQYNKGRVEQFVRKLLKGIPESKYFCGGLEGKFNIGTSRVEVFTTVTDSVDSYKNAIETAIRKKSEDGGRWDLALVEVRQAFKKLDVADNPYYWGKSLFFLHQTPVQDFTIELLSQSNYSLGYSLNNMALACYAKMGGVPWLLKSSPTLSHELVIGIGSANIGQERNTTNQRIMGITTVFSGDGSYIVSNTSKAVVPAAYCDALTSVLDETIEKIQRRMNWQEGDTIRLIFHASVKKFNHDEVEAVRTVIRKNKKYQIEYAFLKISEDHSLHMFDSSTINTQKGRLAPQRGRTFQLSKYEILIYLVGQREMRQETDGHPRGVILNIHKDSTFKDIKYLSIQIYNFASHSWRSYFPNPMPVTISYSDLIARNLGWLHQLPGWSDSIMIGKLGQSQWFL